MLAAWANDAEDHFSLRDKAENATVEVMNAVGIGLVFIGSLLLVGGMLLMLGGRHSFLGSLPGSIRIREENHSMYFPLAACVVISIILTIALNLILHLFHK